MSAKRHLVEAIAVLIGGLSLWLYLAPSAFPHAGASNATRHADKTRPSRGEAQSTFAALSRPATEADLQNQAVRGAAAHDDGLLASDARVLNSGALGIVWLIPTSDAKLCVGVQPAPGNAGGLRLALACGNASAVAENGLSLGIIGYGAFAVVPDGVGEVELRRSNGGVEKRAVPDNVVELAPGQYDAIQFDENAAPRQLLLGSS